MMMTEAQWCEQLAQSCYAAAAGKVTVGLVSHLAMRVMDSSDLTTYGL